MRLTQLSAFVLLCIGLTTLRAEEAPAPVRFGLIRCDLHGYYYAALMAKHTPDLLRRAPHGAGGAYFYLYQQYNEPDRMTAPRVEGFVFAKVWDKRRDAAEAMSRVFLDVPKVCDTLEEVSDDVDLVFIADCNANGEDHLALAAPGLRKGVPTFVDKPFANDLQEAQAIIALAEECKTPVLSLSILRTLPQAARFRERFHEAGGVHFATINGGGTELAGQIHAISLAQNLFGDGVVGVGSTGRTPLAHLFLDYGDRADRPAQGVVLNCDRGPGPHCAYYVSIYGPAGAIHSPAFDDFAFPWGAAENLRLAQQMARTRTPPVPYAEMLENIAVVTAARLAHKEGRLVRLDEVWKR